MATTREAFDAIYEKTQSYNENPNAANPEEIRALTEGIFQELRANEQGESVGIFLESLKHISRTPHGLQLLSKTENIRVLSDLADHREALATLCNLTLQYPPSRPCLRSFPYTSWLETTQDASMLFLRLRLAFLATVETDVETLGPEAFTVVLDGHDETTVTEGCKVLFNVAMRRPDQFKILIPNLIKAAKKWSNSDIVNHITHVLVNFQSADLIPHLEDVDKVIAQAFSRIARDPSADDLAQPFLMLFTHLAQADKEQRKRLKNILCPADVDRSKPMGQGPGVAHALVRLLVFPECVKIRPMVEELFVILFEGNMVEVAKYAGYGSAAGLLVNRQGTVADASPERPAASSASSNSEEHVNPVTGGRDSRDEASSVLNNMTEEEKEREAEKLLVLFDRLNKLDVIKVMGRAL